MRKKENIDQVLFTAIFACGIKYLFEKEKLKKIF